MHNPAAQIESESQDELIDLNYLCLTMSKMDLFSGGCFQRGPLQGFWVKL